MHDEQPQQELRVGPFSVGDLIALGAVIFMSGATWWRVSALERESDRTTSRVTQLEQFAATNYVRRDDYRDDLQEIKEMLQQISADLKTKVDK